MPRLATVAFLLLTAFACVRLPPSARAETPLARGALQSGGMQRTYAWVAPRRGDGGLRPLVIALHGRGGDGVGQEKLSNVAELALREGFVLVLPDGYEKSWHDGRDLGPAAKAGVDDVAFLGALIDRFVQRHAVDPRRVYLLGMSNGGFMALTAACAIPERIAAVASVTGTVSERLAERCAPTLPVPVALFHGTEDPIVPYEGGEIPGHRGWALSAERSAELWARLDRCVPAPATTAVVDAAPNDGTRVGLRTWTGCAGGAEVRLYTVHGGGHTWPGGVAYLPERLIGRTSRDLSATREAWAFLKRFAR